MLISTASPNDTSCHARLRGVGTITRTVNLSGVGAASMTYYAKYASWESGDDVMVEASPDGTTWTTITTHTTSNTSTSHTQYTANLDAFAGQSAVQIRFRGSMTANDTGDQFYVDTIVVTSGASSTDGYINGSVPSPSCGSTPVKRERQLDIRTLEMANALKADGVEIYVVAFGVCATNSTVYTAAQCQSIASGGLIGNTDNDNTGDQRLMKCIASSKPSTNDHYFYASSASGLPTIFTQIAKQIAHRLVE
jgi:hypothetical protein